MKNKTILLQSIVDIATGKLDANASTPNGKYPFFTCAEQPIRIDTYAFNTDAILVSGNGSKVGYVTRYKGKFNAYQRTYVLSNPQNISLDYLYYYLKAFIRPYINQLKHGSSIPYITLPILQNLPVLIGDYNTQHKITDVLLAIDDKIELNDKINKKLNELARLIYDYWFVQFDFPDEDGHPYRVSGGKMVYNDLLKREIPEGWTVEHLDKILTFQRGTEPGSKAYLSNKTSESCIKFHRVGDMLGNCTTWIDGSIYKLYRVKPSDVLVSFDATIGRISTCIDGAISGGIRHIYDPSERISSAFIWQLFQSQRIQDQMLQFVSGRGSSLAHAGGVIKDLAIPYNKTSIQKYQDIVNPIYQLYINNQLEFQQLAQLRDWLLPMLMSGQVVVK